MKDVREYLKKCLWNGLIWGFVFLALIVIPMDIATRHQLDVLALIGAGLLCAALSALMLSFALVARALVKRSPVCPHCRTPVYELNMEKAFLAVIHKMCLSCKERLADDEAVLPGYDASYRPVSWNEFFQGLRKQRRPFFRKNISFHAFLVLAMIPALLTMIFTEKDLSVPASAARALASVFSFGLVIAGCYWARNNDRPVQCPICREAMDETAVRLVRKTGRCGMCGLRLIE